MKPINNAIEPISNYLVSIIRNTENGWYEIEVGIPKSWVFQENEYISCVITAENDSGKLIKISPKNGEVLIDDLISFVVIIVETNGKIVEKEQEFAKQMEEFKSSLEKKAKSFYEELDLLKENSFNDLTNKFKTQIIEPQQTPRRGRKKKISDINSIANETDKDGKEQ